ncbi:hypothetical protein CEUSTIGMA_g6168.t1 [Chlamydomonas eustigma]|uniref:E2F-associated phosphoprotein n=1 Tax=Chlamydomonas eustigma TaxID=1157962 RepID=A0A250X6M6_9CHLO|nr:hypothetical protein CEUSTIGMA_g6168.t1 [Chlamydomonas eustigma]|eukprot:GAX78731.1 hypothetical protein CEUSTIGMA_g6168.t1 [Chlamydomonas eustigma]
MNTKIKNEFDGPNKDAENWWLSESSESDEAPSSSRPKTLKISHVQEDEFFDEGLDEKDELWVAKQRQGRVSDAILSCPGCFTMLTADCQQHQHHHNQYRAMLVVNCEVDDKYALKETRSSSNKDRTRKSKPTEEQQKSVEAEDAAKGAAGPGNDKMIRSNHGSQGIPNCLEDSTELFYAVRCAVCRTEVGVRDSDEVYHFFHVFPSNA